MALWRSGASSRQESSAAGPPEQTGPAISPPALAASAPPTPTGTPDGAATTGVPLDGAATSSAPASPPAASPSVTLVIRSSPPGARVFDMVGRLDLGTTPVTETRRRVPHGKARYRLSLAGHKDTLLTQQTDQDRDDTVTLPRQPRQRGARPGGVTVKDRFE
jgi:hypothetical protein